MTENEAQIVNRMSARLAALQLLATWLLYKSLKEEDDPDWLIGELAEKARAAADSSTGKPEDFRAAFVEEFELILQQSKKLLAGR